MTHQIYCEPWRVVGCGLLAGDEPELLPLDDLGEVLTGVAPAAAKFVRANACCKWPVVRAFSRWPTVRPSLTETFMMGFAIPARSSCNANRELF
jgi:hypothetical protein